MTRWFVMLRNRQGDALALLAEDGWHVALFETEAAARQAGDDQPLGHAYGFEVYPWR